MLNKKTLSVEESVHILFDETNSLVENDAQDEDFELGFVRKDIGKTHESEPHSGANNMENGLELDQSGGSTVNPDIN